jgi:hypothetical protein
VQYSRGASAGRACGRSVCASIAHQARLPADNTPGQAFKIRNAGTAFTCTGTQQGSSVFRSWQRRTRAARQAGAHTQRKAQVQAPSALNTFDEAVSRPP